MRRLTPRLLAMAWLGAVCAAVPAAAASVTPTPVVSGLDRPLYVTHAGDGSGRLFVVEQGGVIQVLPPGGGPPTVFLDIGARVVSPAGTEQGLLSVAFDPHYSVNGFFYVYYTQAADGSLVIARYVDAGNPGVTFTTETRLLVIPHPTTPPFGGTNHNGGQLQFGPDGCLYAGTGDGGGGGDPGRNGQKLTSLLGKLLRLDPATGGPCASGPPNPFPGAPLIWALGLRNPFRFSFDRLTGDLHIGDVGQSDREEIDVQPAGSAGGANYCWSALEGTLPFNGDQSCTTGTATPPLLEYGHTGRRCAITGGYAYRGAAGTLPAGAYVFGDLCSGELFLSQGGFQSVLATTDLVIASFGEDQAGELYVVDLRGAVYRLDGVAGPELTMGLDRLLVHRSGDALRVGIGARNPGPAFQADVYLGVLLPPAGTTAVFITATSPPAGQPVPVSADPRTFPPLATGVTIPAGLEAPMRLLLAHGFTGTEQAGAYELFVALLVPGALADGRIDPGDVIAVARQPFVFAP